jgi:hypothetical protein
MLHEENNTSYLDYVLSLIIPALANSNICDHRLEQNSDLQPQFQGTGISQRIHEG